MHMHMYELNANARRCADSWPYLRCTWKRKCMCEVTGIHRNVCTCTFTCTHAWKQKYAGTCVVTFARGYKHGSSTHVCTCMSRSPRGALRTDSFGGPPRAWRGARACPLTLRAPCVPSRRDDGPTEQDRGRLRGALRRELPGPLPADPPPAGHAGAVGASRPQRPRGHRFLGHALRRHAGPGRPSEQVCAASPHPLPPRPPAAAGERGHRRLHAGPRPVEVTPVSGLWPFVSNPCHSGGCHGDAHGATEHFPLPSARLRANPRQLLFPCDGAHTPVPPA